MIIKTTTRELQNKINNVLKKKIDARMSFIISKIRRHIKELIRQEIQNHPAWQSMLNGKLRYHFGFVNPEANLEPVLNKWVNSVDIQLRKAKTISGGMIEAKLELRAVQADYEDVLALSAAKIKTDDGDELPWLEWLLIEGDAAIIRGFHIELGSFPQSRSGGAVMRKEGLWSVPPEFSGTKGKNMITEVVDSKAVRDGILSIFKQVLK